MERRTRRRPDYPPAGHNGQPYSGINILSLWISATVQNFAAPIWMTFRQALELDANVRKGEKGSLVVYANSITRTEHDNKIGEDVERKIPYMKGYTVEQKEVKSVIESHCPSIPNELNQFVASRHKIENLGRNAVRSLRLRTRSSNFRNPKSLGPRYPGTLWILVSSDCSPVLLLLELI
jgi:antirestriction protein ArdC